MPTNSLERALELLELLDRMPGGLRNADMCRELDIPPSTASYILTRLEHGGYVQRDRKTRRYHMGLSVVALAHGALRDLGIRSFSEPVLYRLASYTGLSAGIGVLRRNSVLIVDRVEGREARNRAAGARVSDTRTREHREIGRELPIHTNALGKVLLAYLDPESREELLRDMKLERITPKTIVSKDRFVAEIEAVRNQGCATALEEHYPGVRALSVPILDATGSVIAALALNGGIAEPIWRDQKTLMEPLQIAAVEIARRSLQV